MVSTNVDGNGPGLSDFARDVAKLGQTPLQVKGVRGSVTVVDDTAIRDTILRLVFND